MVREEILFAEVPRYPYDVRGDMVNRKKTVFWKAGVLLWLVAALVLGGAVRVGAVETDPAAAGEPEEEVERDEYTLIGLFSRAMEMVRESYVDEDQTTYDKLVEGALEGLMASLDEDSELVVLDPQLEWERAKGEFGGIGIVVSFQRGDLTVISAIEGTPGFAAGLQSGDRILEIDGEPAEDISMSEAVRRLRGEVGSKVHLRILRASDPDVQEVEVERAVIRVPSVRDARMLDEDIGYIRVTQISEKTPDALREQVQELIDRGMEALVLDVRGNPGGSLDGAVELSQMFLRRGAEIASVRGRTGGDRVYRAKGQRAWVAFPVAVIVNRGTAREAEVLASALKDNRRAVLVGEQTFGKGVVQSILPLDDRRFIRLTTGKVYTPAGQGIDGQGVEPDVVVEMPPERWQEILAARVEASAEDETVLEKGRDKEDLQLRRAVELLRAELRMRFGPSPG